MRMQVTEVLASSEANAALDRIAQDYGIPREKAVALIQAVVPEFSRHIERNTFSRGGIADMVALIGDSRYAVALDNPEKLTDPSTQAAGIAALDTILGSKYQSRAIAARASSATGLSEILIKQLLPIIASIIIGGLSKGGSGALQDILQRIPGLPGGGSARPAQPSFQPQAPAGGGRSPLPLPGENTPLDAGNPYGDLSETIRRGGYGGGTAGGGAGGLPGIVRSILGSLLGFQNGGVVSWIIRLIVVRYGWTIVKWFFGRMLLGR